MNGRRVMIVQPNLETEMSITWVVIWRGVLSLPVANNSSLVGTTLRQGISKGQPTIKELVIADDQQQMMDGEVIISQLTENTTVTATTTVVNSADKNKSTSIVTTATVTVEAAGGGGLEGRIE